MGVSICDIFQILEGLRYMHEKCKIIHTDIKPENVLITMSHEDIKVFQNMFCIRLCHICMDVVVDGSARSGRHQDEF